MVQSMRDLSLPYIRVRWREGSADTQRSIVKNVAAFAVEKAEAHRVGRAMRSPLAVVVSHPRPTNWMLETRARYWPETPVFALVHGTTSVEFPPTNYQYARSHVNHWFTATREAHILLGSQEGLKTSLLGNLFRGDTHWGTLRPAPAIALDGELPILFVGTLTENKVKPLEVLIEALQQRPNWTLTVAGGGPEMTRLQEVARRHGVLKQTSFAGQRSDVRPLILQARVVLTAGRGALEAGTAGRAVVIANSNGLHGPLTIRTLKDAESANFTGRSISSVNSTIPAMIAAITQASRLDTDELLQLQERLWNHGSSGPLLELIRG